MKNCELLCYFLWHFKSLSKLHLTVGQNVAIISPSFSEWFPPSTPLSPPVCVWIHPSLILFLYGSLKPQRSFVRLFVWHPVEGVCLSSSSSSSSSPFILHFPLSTTSALLPSLAPSTGLSSATLSPPLSPHLSFISLVLHQVLLLSHTLSTLLLADRGTVQRPGSSPPSLPGRKNKQASTCSQGILMTSITLASLPAKLQAAWETQWTLNEPV